MAPISTRLQTRLTGRYVRTTSGSQSLERGLSLLRAFRVGTSVLTNAELADRTGLARPTVSRLARSLVDSGFLIYDHADAGYRLGPVLLSLALNFRVANLTMEVALPLMRKVAETNRVNIGLAMLDQTEMVYLESIRLSRGGISRKVSAGSRIPVALTALGRAYLSAMLAEERKALMRLLQPKHGKDWAQLRRQIDGARADVHAQGYCWAQWQQRIFSVATPLVGASGECYALNISLARGDADLSCMLATYGGMLLKLKEEIIDSQTQQ